MGLFSRFFRRRAGVTADHDMVDELLSAVRDGKEGRTDVYRTLLDAVLYVPGEIHDRELYIRPYTVDGRKTVLIFTSPARMAEGLRDRPEYIAVNGRILFSALPSFDGLTINYGTRTMKNFTASEVRSMLDGSIFETAAIGADRIIGQPREYPVRLMDLLAEKLPGRPEIEAAYIAQCRAGSAEPEVVIAFATDMPGEMFQAFLDRVRTLAEAAGREDITFTRLGNDPLGHYLLSETEPFYRSDRSARSKSSE